MRLFSFLHSHASRDVEREFIDAEHRLLDLQEEHKKALDRLERAFDESVEIAREKLRESDDA